MSFNRRLFALIVLSALTPFGFADNLPLRIGSAPYSVWNYWPGEYPEGYEIVRSISLQGYEDLDLKRSERSCTLAAGRVIHPWAVKTTSEFAYFSPVDQYVAVEDFLLESIPEVNVQVGTALYLLSYLSEGYCMLQVQNQIVEAPCLDIHDQRSAVLVTASPFLERRLFRTTCEEGGSLWIDAQSFEPYMSDGDVKWAEITGYGEVREP